MQQDCFLGSALYRCTSAYKCNPLFTSSTTDEKNHFCLTDLCVAGRTIREPRECCTVFVKGNVHGMDDCNEERGEYALAK
jgi:hypothetical protein